MSLLSRTLQFLLAFAALVGGLARAEEFQLRDGETVLFIGDSNTYADHYIQYIEAFLFTRFPDKKFKVVNRGMPSETAAGTSEPSHIPPRPDVHTRFSAVVTNVAPDVLIANYGMNDGIYLSPNEPVFEKYKNGIRRLIKRTSAETDARLILATPPPFDARPFANRPPTSPAGYQRPATDYDNTLKEFSAWLVSLREEGERVVDIHSPIAHHLRQRREGKPAFQMAGDGVHINETGHMLWALELLTALHAPAEISEWTVDLSQREHARELPLPMPHDPKWDRESVEVAGFDEQLNRLSLKIAQPKKIGYAAALSIGGSSLRATVQVPPQATEVDLYPAYLRLVSSRAQEALRLVQERRRLMLELWVRDDPHPRLAGMHKSSFVSQLQIDELEREIRKLCSPVPVILRLVPVAGKP